MSRWSAVFRAACTALLIALETLVTWPVFVIAWLASAVWVSAKAGFAFAAMDDDATKRAALRQMMGEK